MPPPPPSSSQPASSTRQNKGEAFRNSRPRLHAILLLYARQTTPLMLFCLAGNLTIFKRPLWQRYALWGVALGSWAARYLLTALSITYLLRYADDEVEYNGDAQVGG